MQAILSAAFVSSEEGWVGGGGAKVPPGTLKFEMHFARFKTLSFIILLRQGTKADRHYSLNFKNKIALAAAPQSS